MSFNPVNIRHQFPLLSEMLNGKQLTYLDSAATSQKPNVVIEALQTFYRSKNANPNRGVYPLAEKASLLLDHARSTVQDFIGAQHAREIIFLRSATEGINFVARTWGDQKLCSTDTIVLTTMEHHANIIPWMQLRDRTGCSIRWLQVDEKGTIDLAELDAVLGSHSVQLVACTGLSNVLGARPPLEEIIRRSKASGARVLVDASQLIAHAPLNVRELQPDFLTFSGHKIFGPMGVGVVYAQDDILRNLPPFLGGGDMIEAVTRDGFTPTEYPRRFEAGTLPLADIHGLAVALEWLSKIDRDALHRHESSLLRYAREGLQSFQSIRILGPEALVGCLSFVVDGVHPHDLTEILGSEGICLRAGHHCAQVLHRELGLQATTRLSVAPYTIGADIDRFFDVLPRAISLLQK